MKTRIYKGLDIPARLRNIYSKPRLLYGRGANINNLCNQPCLSVVGSRAVSPYGKAVIEQLLGDVVRAGVVIVSGLALGTDALAHKIAVDNRSRTIAVLPASVNQIYPVTNRGLANAILEQGGALVSEYPDATNARRENFIARNRLVSGFSQALLITEAAEKSGTLLTANFALEQGRDVLVVPGNITSPTSVGTNNLLKIGATPVTSSKDILRALGIKEEQPKQELLVSTPEEASIIALLKSGVHDGGELLSRSELAPNVYYQTMTMLEVNAVIKPLGADKWTLN